MFAAILPISAAVIMMTALASTVPEQESIASEASEPSSNYNEQLPSTEHQPLPFRVEKLSWWYYYWNLFSKRTLRDYALCNHFDPHSNTSIDFQVSMVSKQKVIFCSNPDVARRVLKDGEHNPNYVQSSNKVSKILDHFTKTNILISNGEAWHKYRSVLEGTWNPHGLGMEIEHLLPKIVNFIEEDKPIDVNDLAKRITLDVMGSALLGAEIDSLSRKDDQLLTDLNTIVGAMTTLTILVPDIFLRPIYSAVDRVRAKVRAFYETSMVSGSGKVINALREAELQGTISKEEAVDLMCFLFIAGHDTTASSLASLLYEMAKDQQMQDRIRNTDDPEYEEACVKENLRLNPATAFIQSRETKAGSCIPEGYRFSIPVSALHFSPKYWTDPFKFDPTRFMSSSEEGSGSSKNNMKAFMPFGYGKRQCPGMTMA